MKKLFTTFLCTLAILSVTTSVFATEVKPFITSSNSTQLVAQKADEVVYTIEIDGKPMKPQTLKIVKINNRIMVPLRVISERLGFTISWDHEKKAIHMDDGKMQTDITLDREDYFAYSSKAEGMAAPQNLGVAPKIIGGVTYVPVELYNILLANQEAVTVKGNVISIVTDASDDSNMAQIPSPLVEYSTLEEARAAVGFQFEMPTVMQEGYEKKDIIVISNDLAEIFYTKNDNTILYRTAKGSDDISGDYTTYDVVKTINVDNMAITTKGSKESIHLAIWSKDGVSFSLSFDEGINESQLITIIRSIKL